MKRSLLALGLTLTSLSGMAATSADLILKGIIPLNLEISIVHETLASNLDLTRQVSNEKVATLTEKSNSASGYKIKAKSTNAGKLVNASDVNSFVNYSLTYNGSGVSLNSSPVEIYSTSNLRGTYTKDLKISYNQPSNLSAGTYQDTVQFTIEAN
jgi:uncharacterized protein (UPF0333 family)